MPDSDIRKAKLRATPDNSVNIDRLKDNSKIISAMWRFSGVNGVCQSGRNNKTGSPRRSRVCGLARYQLRLFFRIVNRSASFELTAKSLAEQKLLPRIVVLPRACVLYRRRGTTASFEHGAFTILIYIRRRNTMSAKEQADQSDPA